jgi:hypothetical protein
VFIAVIFDAFWYRRPVIVPVHRSVVEGLALPLYKTDACYKALCDLDEYFEKHGLTKFARSIAFKRPSSRRVFTAQLGLPPYYEEDFTGFFQTAASPIMEGIVDLHHDIMFLLTYILCFVLYLL